MKISIFSKGDKDETKNLLEGKADLVEEDPDVVVVKGGDGTLMRSEAHFPGIPKLLVRDSHICKLCPDFKNEEIINRFLSGDYYEEEYFKLETKAKGKSLKGINDIIVHNKDPRHAIRYHVFIDGESFLKKVIGDGVVVATPLGATGYYRSITDSFFETGIGLAFNNSTEQSDHVVLREDSRIKVEITRGPAVVYADNRKEKIELEDGDEVGIQKSEDKARIIRFS